MSRDDAAAPALRIAIWSGPRNLSTALMRSFENRGDCAVADEPLYAHYLAATGLPHPGREQVIAAGDTDAARVIQALVHGPVPDGRPLWYQKHMTHHLLPALPRGWVAALANVFLIRDPALVVASYLRTREAATPDDLGVPQQAALFDAECDRLGRAPPVIDAEAFLHDPRGHLGRLCTALGIGFTPRMLAWPAGRRASDGVWAPHWYAAVVASTGFEAPRERPLPLEGEAARVADACRPAYERLAAVARAQAAEGAEGAAVQRSGAMPPA